MTKPTQQVEEKATPPEVPHTVSEPAPKEERDRRIVNWKPGYYQLKSRGKDGMQIGLRGSSAQAYDFVFKHKTERNRNWDFALGYTRFQFEPEPKAKFPFQKTLNWNQISFSALTRRSSEHFGYGLTAQQFPEFTRTSLESVSSKIAFLYGPCAELSWNFGSFEYVGDYIGWFGSGLGYSTKQRVQRHLSRENRWLLGVEGDASSLKNQSGSITIMSAQFSLGFEF